MRAANLALKFALELAALGAFAYWGATVTDGALAIVLTVVTPLGAGILWGRFAAPGARNRLPLRLRVPFELGVFALAAIALMTASPAAALVFTFLVITNSLLLRMFGQWETEQRGHPR